MNSGNGYHYKNTRGSHKVNTCGNVIFSNQTIHVLDISLSNSQAIPPRLVHHILVFVLEERERDCVIESKLKREKLRITKRKHERESVSKKEKA